MAEPDRFFGAPREIRDRFYQHALNHVSVFHIKRDFVKYKTLRPYNEQWLLPVQTRNSPAVCMGGVSGQTNDEMYDCIKRRAFSSNHTRIIARIINFDFRALIKFLESLSPAEKSKLNNASQPKLIALLNVTSSNDIDAKKLGTWLRFCKTAGVTVNYHIGIEPGFEVSLDQMYHLKLAFGEDEDMLKIYRACVLWEAAPEASEEQIKRWYKPIAVGAEDLDDELEDSRRGAGAKEVSIPKGDQNTWPAQRNTTTAPKLKGLLGLVPDLPAGYVRHKENDTVADGEGSEESTDDDLDSDMMSDSDDDE